MSLSTSLLWRGLLAVGVGIVSVVWPDITGSVSTEHNELNLMLTHGSFRLDFRDLTRGFSASRAISR